MLFRHVENMRAEIFPRTTNLREENYDRANPLLRVRIVDD